MSDQPLTTMPLTVTTKDDEITALRIALHDAIRRPMGVVPESAERFVSASELDAAEARRSTNKNTPPVRRK